MTERWPLLVLLPYIGWLIFFYDYHFIDNVNLALHEGGHMLLGFGGGTLHFLAGSLGQLLFPLAFTLKFYLEQQVLSTAVCAVWLAESLMNVARYLGDAKAQLLPLVGGHIHDWSWLLSRWGLLDSCEGIASFLHFMAALMLIGIWLWAWRHTAVEDASQ